MRLRGILRPLLLLLILGAVPMEALFLTRLSLIRTVHEAYPYVGLDRDGELLCYDVERVERNGRLTHVFHHLDAERRVVDTITPPPDLVTLGAWGWPYGSVPSLEPRFLRQGTTPARTGILEVLANDLNRREARRRDLAPPATAPSYGSATPGGGDEQGRVREIFVVTNAAALERFKPMPLHWQAEEGRLVCRETASGRVLAGIGPDGYARGESAAQGESFVAIGPSITLGTYMPDGPWPGFALLEGDRRIVALLAPAVPPAESVPADSVEPLELAVETRPIHPDAGAAWTEPPWIARTDDEVLILLTDGSLVGRIRLDAGEDVITTAGDRQSRGHYLAAAHGSRLPAPPPPDFVGISTSLMPSRPATKRIRMRLYRPGLPMVQREVVLEPTRPSEIIPADFAAALTLLRPFPLNAAASLSPLPRDSAASLRWWWRDPWLADGSYPGWLTLSLALAAFLAWRARKSARERCATVREARLWTTAVFLLGPIGFLWMRLVLPRVPVEPLGNARRAVDLDASPSADAPWPEPRPEGIEVFS